MSQSMGSVRSSEAGFVEYTCSTVDAVWIPFGPRLATDRILTW